MNAELAGYVRWRARHICEYCRLPEALRVLGFHIDHIIARQHGGKTIPENLALACGRCNRFKGPNLSGVDPLTQDVIRLFDPRSMRWIDHFAVERVHLVGITPIGRTTIRTLNMNDAIDLLIREQVLWSGGSVDVSDPLA